MYQHGAHVQMVLADPHGSAAPRPPRYFLKVLGWCPLQLWGVEEGGDRPEIDFIPEKGPPVNPPHGQYLICGHLWVK